jgi:hypothetical protein
MDERPQIAMEDEACVAEDGWLLLALVSTGAHPCFRVHLFRCQSKFVLLLQYGSSKEGVNCVPARDHLFKVLEED